MPIPPHDPPTRPSGRDTRRRIAYAVVGLVLAAIFIGGYVFGLLRHM